MLSSGHVDWTAAVKAANDQLISPALWQALRDTKQTANLPADVREYLHEIYRLNHDRNKRLRVQALGAIRSLNAVGVVPLLLKGAASLFLEVYNDPGSRVMLDLDILVPPDEAENCWKQLRRFGYVPVDCRRDFSRHHHLKPLQRPGEYGTIEIHRYAFSAEANQIVPASWMWTRCRSATESGATFCVPDATSYVLHNVLHEAVDHGGFQRAWGSLRSLHELAQLASLYRDCIDWTQVVDFFERNGSLNILSAWLYLACRLFGCHQPGAVPATLSARIYYTRYRLQARWQWANAFAARALLFSARGIRERYAADDSVRSVNEGRFRLLLDVVGHYIGQIVQWVWQRSLGSFS